LLNSNFDPIEVISGNTYYDELTYIGYYQPLNLLQATFAIKQPTGYLGTLCWQGSTEYIRFYIGYGDVAGWQDIGYSGFNVHDIPNADDCLKDSEKPLYYSAIIPWTPNLQEQRPCVSPVLPLIRGIASWNIPPPANTPSWIPIWGNVLNQNVQITPRLLLLPDLIDLIPKDKLDKLPPDIVDAPDTPITLPPPKALDLPTLASAYEKVMKASRFGFSSLYQVITSSGSQVELPAKHNTWSKLQLDLPGALRELENLAGNTSYEQPDGLGIE
jgi:hypothetical protein